MPFWSTADVHPRDRVAYWVDGLSGAIAHVDCDPRRDDDPVQALYLAWNDASHPLR